MGFLNGALAQLESIVGNGADEHSDALHAAIQNAEAHPDQLANLVGRLTNHPEIGSDVQSWMQNPIAQQFLGRAQSGTPSTSQSASASQSGGNAQDDQDDQDDQF